MVIAYLAIAVLLLIDGLSMKESVLSRLQRQKTWVRWGVYLLLIFAVLILGVYGSGAATEVFAYERF
jgi:hypothetical protein